MKCKNCKKEFKKQRHWQKYCSDSCRNQYWLKNRTYRLIERERLLRKEFDTLNYRDDPLKPEPHRDFERSCQLQTVVKTGLYIPYRMFDDQDFIGVKNLSIELFNCKNCTWKKKYV